MLSVKLYGRKECLQYETVDLRAVLGAAGREPRNRARRLSFSLLLICSRSPIPAITVLPAFAPTGRCSAQKQAVPEHSTRPYPPVHKKATDQQGHLHASVS